MVRKKSINGKIYNKEGSMVRRRFARKTPSSKRANFPRTHFKDNKEGLTAKQAKFVDEYLVDLNATKAAIRAGYSKKTAFVIGCGNLSKPKIAKAIQKRREELKVRTQIDQEWVLRRYKMLVDYCVDDFFFDDGSMKPFSEIPREKLYAIGGFRQSKQTITEKDKRTITNRIREFKLANKKDVLDSIGKYLGMFEKDNEQKRPNVVQPIQINVELVD